MRGLARRAAPPAAAVAGLSALARDLALLGRIHRRKPTLRSAALGRRHVISPFLECAAGNACFVARFTMLIQVRATAADRMEMATLLVNSVSSRNPLAGHWFECGRQPATGRLQRLGVEQGNHCGE